MTMSQPFVAPIASNIWPNNSQHRLSISRVLDGVKMPSNVQKWQEWGLITSHKALIEDHDMCENCRKIVWAYAMAWGVSDGVLERMYAGISDMKDEDNGTNVDN